MDSSNKLRALAEWHGIQVSYTDIHGNVKDAPPRQIISMLQILGVSITDANDLEPALREARYAAWTELLPPVVTAWDGHGSVDLHLPSHVADADYHYTVTTEQGKTLVGQGSLYDVRRTATTHIDGNLFVRRSLSLPPLPTGYHELSLDVEGYRSAQALIMSAPRRTYSPPKLDKTWGLFAPLYALYSDSSLGAGNLTDLQRVIDWVAQKGGSVVGTLPLLATFLKGPTYTPPTPPSDTKVSKKSTKKRRAAQKAKLAAQEPQATDASAPKEPFEPSPYSPATRLAWSEFYLDIQALDEFATTPQTQKLWASAATQTELKRLHALDDVDYEAQSTLMTSLLEPMAITAWNNPARRTAMEAFIAEHSDIDDYSRFRAAIHRQRAPWNQWPEELKQGSLPESAYLLEHYRYHVYVQWCLHIQLASLSKRARDAGLGLYLDLPIGVHPEGFDVWKYRDVFATGLSCGAPPDALFAGGQNWAFPPLHPRRIRENRYRYLIEVIRNHLQYAGVLRIDHVMGLHRIYVIPSHASATEGLYIRYQPDEWYAILSIESHRHQTLLLGENLGTVPHEVTDAMADHGVRGMHVVQYAARRDPELALPPATINEIASLNTHDMPPFAAFWNGDDADLRHSLGFTDGVTAQAEKQERTRLTNALCHFLSRSERIDIGAPAHDAFRVLSRRLGRSESPLVLLNLEDLWGELKSQNVPGTYREHPNWKHRAAYPFEVWSANSEILAVLDDLADTRRTSNMRGQVRYDVSRLTDDDLHLFNEGTHQRIADHLGAHPMRADGLEGTNFAVWAPSADYVSVIGDFNEWDNGRTPLRARGHSGVWEGFVTGVGPGDLYKFHIAGPNFRNNKIDPIASRYETPPRTASVVSKSHYEWQDAAWLEQRARRKALDEPMSVYEVHLGSWRRIPEEGHRSLNYREIAKPLSDYVRQLGFTHIEFLPLMEHPYYPSWGYQTTGYFAPTSRYGSPDDFRYMLDVLHQDGIGVLLDWVPSHFPTDDHALARYDGTHLYEHADPREGYHPDWKSAIFNYGRHEVQSFLVSSARYWLEEFHADGLRVDAVASMLYRDYSRKQGEWIPNKYGNRENLEAIDLLRRLNTAVYSASPGIQTIAEESTAWGMVSRPADVGGLGFGFKWDMGWMHDTLKYFARDPIHRRHHHHELTFRMIYAFNENFVLPLSHDEVVHGKGSLLHKMPGDRWQKFANLRSLYGYMYGQPGKKLLFQGCEFAQEREWQFAESLDWHLLDDPMHKGVQSWVAALNQLYRSEPGLHQLDCDPDGFEWIDMHDAQSSVYIFLRKAKPGSEHRPVIVACNLTPVPRYDYRIGVPAPGTYVELANSDDKIYGGSGVVNPGRMFSEVHNMHNREHSILATLPPLGVVFIGMQPPTKPTSSTRP